MAGGRGSQQVKIEGVEALSKKLRALPEIVERAARKAVKDETDAVADDMRRNAPRLTGELVEGIQSEMNNKTITGKAVSTARHTPFVVHGTEDTPANDFMTPAARRSEKRFKGRVVEEVRAELKRISK